MVRYPISVPSHPYGGRNPAKRRKAGEFNEVASLCEKYINKEVEESEREFVNFTYVEIGRALKLDRELVCDVLMPVDGGNTGMTVSKRGKLPGDPL